MDWGFGNPNRTAAFIAILMVAIWSFAYLRQIGFWICLSIFCVLGLCLVHTMSRGGLVACLVGLAPVIWFSPKPWSTPRICACILVAVGIGVASIHLKLSSRLEGGIITQDMSIINRLTIWSVTPAMMADAPSGWGLGNASNAYQQWYQPLENVERYKNLINSHLTWMVELGWPFRFAYIFGWLAVFCLLFPNVRRRYTSVFFGVWLSFFVSAFFSAIADNIILWVVPLICLVAASACLKGIFFEGTVFLRLRRAAIGSLVACLILLVVGKFRSSGLSGSQEGVIFGQQKPTAFIFYDQSTMGSSYGQSIRRARQEGKLPFSLAILLRPKDAKMLSEDSTVVIGRQIPSVIGLRGEVSKVARIVLLNPEFSPPELGINEQNRSKVRAYFGEFARSVGFREWAQLNADWRIEGIGEFVPNWVELIGNG